MRNSFYEQILHREGVQFEYVEKLPLERIDAAKSLRNQARLTNPIDEELVEAYLLSVKNGEGDQFPPFVTYQTTPRSRDILMDGNNRREAFDRANRKEHDAYRVLTTDPKVIDRITWTFNNKISGKRNSYDDALEHAASYVRKHGITAKEAATIWAVNCVTLNQKIKILESRDVLARNNVKVNGIKDDVIFRLSSLSPLGEDVFCRAVMVLDSCGLGSTDAEELVRNVKRAPTAEAKVACIEKLAASERAIVRKAETKGGKISVRHKGPRYRMLSQLKGLRDTTDDFPMDVLIPVGSEYVESREHAKDVVRRLTIGYRLGEVPVHAREE